MKPLQAMTNNTMRVKQINTELIKNTLKAMEHATKLTIANMTGLSVATCGNLLNELLRTGEVIETDMEESSGGRPARRYKYNAEYSHIACLIVRTEGGISSLAYTVANLLGDVIESRAVVLDTIDEQSIDQQVEALIDRFDTIKAIGIGIPGVANQGVIGVCDVDALAGVALGPQLKEKYEVEIIIENDMNLTVYGFYQSHNYEAEQTLAVVTFPKDHFPGAGYMVNGKLLKGNTHFAGEVSFLPLDMSRSEQLDRIRRMSGLVPLAVHTLTSIIAIMNPLAIIMTGELSHEERLEDIRSGCLRHIPSEHMPELYVQADTQAEYWRGLIAMTLESLTFKLQLVEIRN